MRLDSAAGIMAREQGLRARECQQPLADGRLVGVHVERDAAEHVLLERVGERVVVDERAPRDVDEPRAGPEPPQAVGVDDAAGARRRAEHDAVGAAHERLERRAVARAQPGLYGGALALHVVVRDLHAEARGAPVRDLLPDVAEAHEAEHVAAQVVRERRRALVGRPEGGGRARGREAVRQRAERPDDERHGEVGDGLARCEARVAVYDACANVSVQSRLTLPSRPSRPAGKLIESIYRPTT